MRLHLILTCFLAVFATSATADGLQAGCGGYSDVASIPAPVEAHILDIDATEDFPVFVRVVLHVLGEPVSSGDLATIHVFSHQADEEFACYVLHSGPGDEFTTGFNGILVEKAFFFRNEERNVLELFLPVYEYPYATSPEDYRARLIEIDFDSDGRPSIVE